MRPEPTSDLTELVLHVLAHARLGGPGCVHDPRYCAWARARAPSEATEVLEHDAALLERLWSGGRAPAVVHAWPELWRSIAELQAVGICELAQVQRSQVRAPELLARLQAARSPAIELLHATLGALAPWFAAWHAVELDPALGLAADRMAPWLDQAVRVLPSLAGARVELSWVLGPRGRGFASRIVVGAPAEWNGIDARIPAVLALHEQAVIDRGAGSYVEAEWAALTGLAARMIDAGQQLRQAHAQWLASLELRPLLAQLHAGGSLARDELDALLHDRAGRPARLAALVRRG